MKRLLAILVLTGLLVFCATGCGGEKNDDQKNEDTEVVIDSTDATQAQEEVFAVKTKYGDLKYPEKWKDQVEVQISEDEPYTVSFLKKDDKTAIFDLHFGKGNGYLLGTLENDGNSVEVYVDDAELDESAKDYETLCAIQEDVNVILQNLIKDTDFKVSNATVPDTSSQVYEIKTSIATFCYPEKWKNKITVKDNGDSVVFNSGDVDVFELHLGGDKGFSVGSYDGKDLRLVTFDFEQYRDDNARFEELCAMQEDANTILTYLADDPKFKAK